MDGGPIGGDSNPFAIEFIAEPRTHWCIAGRSRLPAGISRDEPDDHLQRFLAALSAGAPAPRHAHRPLRRHIDRPHCRCSLGRVAGDLADDARHRARLCHRARCAPPGRWLQVAGHCQSGLGRGRRLQDVLAGVDRRARGGTRAECRSIARACDRANDREPALYVRAPDIHVDVVAWMSYNSPRPDFCRM